MSISLNNHESRIKALESAGSGSWTYGSNANGSWIKDNKSSVKIEWGELNTSQTTRTFPLTFNTKPALQISTVWNSASSRGYFYHHITTVSASSFSIVSADRGYIVIPWIAIGILYTYRYIIKSAQKFAPLSYLFNKEV